jgi:alcohol dehydrogenase (cytochrome c)
MGPQGKPLKGPEFMQKYGGKSPAVLFDVLRTTMPTGRAGSLDLPTYAALTAFLLRENAIGAGEQPLPSDARELAKMLVPASGFSLDRLFAVCALKVPTLPNPLTGFTPVTHEDLAAPPAKDWLTPGVAAGTPMASVRSSRSRHRTSPRFAWPGAGPCRPVLRRQAPLVRDGTLFVEGFGDIVQAIDAKSGDLLRSTRIRSSRARRRPRNAASRCGATGFHRHIRCPSAGDAHRQSGVGDARQAISGFARG